MIDRILRGTPEERVARRNLDRLGSKAKPTPAEQRILKESSALNWNYRLRQIKAGIPSLVAVGLATFGLVKLLSTETPTPPSWLTIQDRDLLGNKTVAVAINAATLWNDRYNCGRDVTIKRIGKVKTEPSRTPGMVTKSFEEAHPGLIEISEEAPDVRGDVLHAMTHACQPNESTPTTPFILSSGDSFIIITGYHGATVLFTDANGTPGQKFTKTEEALAERNAHVFPGYGTNNREQIELGREALGHFPLTSTLDVTRFTKTNDYPGIVRVVMGLNPNESVEPDHVYETMKKYQLAANK